MTLEKSTKHGVSDVRVLRGGAWDNDAGLCRAAFRLGNRAPSYRTTSFGFRVAIVGAPTAKTPPVAMVPFVILAKDKRDETRHATLAEAVRDTQAGDIIEIRPS